MKSVKVLLDKHEPAIQKIARNWGWTLFFGVSFFVIGMIAIMVPYSSAQAIGLVLGCLLVIAAIVNFVCIFKSENTSDVLGYITLCVLYSASGAIILISADYGLNILTLLLSFLFILEGITKVLVSIRGREFIKQWGWFCSSGILSVALGAFILWGFPWSSFWAIGMFFGVNMMATGAALIIVAISSKQFLVKEGPLEKSETSSTEPEDKRLAG